jgi:hypothetical protein
MPGDAVGRQQVGLTQRLAPVHGNHGAAEWGPLALNAHQAVAEVEGQVVAAVLDRGFRTGMPSRMAAAALSATTR